ncbi:MAG: response regulator [Eubacterium sp.]|nr:response regulator [Eubacterium sp.]
MKEQENKSAVRFLVLVALIVATLVTIGTLWMGQSAKKANYDTVRAISSFYLDELAGRREQVIASNLNSHIRDIRMAVSLLTENDLRDLKHLRAYQTKMRDLYGLDKFAFVGSDGLIYTSQGVRRNLKDYDFDPEKLSDPKTSVRSIGTVRKAVIAVPVDDIKCEDVKFRVCFMEIDMDVLLRGLSLQSDSNDTTFCNIYTRKGEAFTNMVLGGLAKEDNLLKALKRAKYDSGSSMEQVENDFAEGKPNIVSFTYDGIRETLDYVPVEGTDWMLTYLVRESVISEQVSDISERLTRQSLMQTILTALVMLGLFVLMMQQVRRNAKMMLEQETFEAESRIKQEEMEQRLELQEELLAQEKKRVQQDKMITAMASDYRSVYYVDLDRNEGKCYRSIAPESDICPDGKGFDFEKEFREYADKYVDEKYKEGFLKYIDIDNIREQLSSNSIIVHRYLTVRDGKERYEMLRMAGVRHPQDRDDDIVHAIGVGFTDVDEEIREEMAQSQALSDALAAAEDASKAKTAFLSNMSHEIRTPMNAIIGLDNIALSDPDLPEKTRGYLEKIDGSAHHLLGLINDILDVSRIEAGRLTLKNEEFSFSTLLEQVNTIIGGQCNDKGLDYECHVTNSVDDYYIGDNMKLKQVLINILGNSVKFTPEGGKVELSVAKTASFEGKTTLTFTMSDTGIGMDESFIPKMFEPFSQEDSVSVNRYGSTGLGMAITKSLVEKMNGNISVSSKKGEGTTFTVAVTLMDSDKKSEGREDTEVRIQDLSVLIVDDDEIACEHSRLVLEGVGISADTVMSGKEAVEMVKIHEARREPYNMILLDLKMPEMDGVETAKQIRAVVGRDSVIIIITAYNWEDVLDEAVSAGVDSFIAKPLFAANVLEEFKAALNKRKERTEEHKADLEGRKILLAEDMAVNAEIMKELLKMKGMEVDHAENGRICVDMFQMEPEGYYDAILMDMRMPEMDGLEATRAIRALPRKDAKEIPVIALTANAFDEDVQKSLQAGLNAHLSKPVEPSSLFATLEKLIKD